MPLAAELTPATVADSEAAPTLLCRIPAEVRFVLGNQHYKTPALRAQCAEDERCLVTMQPGRYPHTDEGVEVRRIFHTLCSITIENFNEQLKGIFRWSWASANEGVDQHPALRGGCDFRGPIDVVVSA
jgi:hypothetical protein